MIAIPIWLLALIIVIAVVFGGAVAVIGFVATAERHLK